MRTLGQIGGARAMAAEPALDPPEDDDCTLEEDCQYQAEDEFARDGYNLAWWLESRAITAECAGTQAEVLRPADDIQSASADRLFVSVLHPSTNEAVRRQAAQELFERYMQAMKPEIIGLATDLYRQEVSDRNYIAES